MKEAHLQQFWCEQTDFLGDAIARFVVRDACPHLPRGGDVLDAGAGSGALLAYLRRSGAFGNCVGVDSAARADQGILEGDVTRLQFPDGAFSVAFCTEVLEHLPDEQVEKALAELRRVLAPGGFLVVTVPFQEDLTRNLMVCPECGHRFHPWLHLQSFSPDRLRDLSSRFGFEVLLLKLHYFQTQSKVEKFLPRLAFLFPILERFLRRRKGPEGMMLISRKT